MPRICQVISLGVCEYQKAWLYQEKLRSLRIQEEIPDVLLLLEHPPVFTLGKKGGKENLLSTSVQLKKEGIRVYEVDRGGDITYHGPGQLVGYPILDLNRHGRDIHRYVRLLEEVLIKTLKEYGINARRVDGYTGVWVADEKIAAIGISVRRWVTTHGFALNINPNLEHFKMINPCGITDHGVTSVVRLQKRPVAIEELSGTLVKNFGTVFNLRCDMVTDYDGKWLHRSIETTNRTEGLATSQPPSRPFGPVPCG